MPALIVARACALAVAVISLLVLLAGAQPGVINTIDLAGGLMDRIALALQPNDNPLVVLRQIQLIDIGPPLVLQRNLVMLGCGDPDCASGAVTTLLSNWGPNSDTEFSIIVGSDGFPLFTYQNSSRPGIHIVHCTVATCASGRITIADPDSDSTSRIGRTDIIIGSDGNPVIAYYSTLHGVGLWFCNNVECSSGRNKTLSFNSPLLGEFGLSLMIATDGFLTIASYAGPPNRLNAPFIMHCNSTECTGITISRLTTNTLTNGAFVSIANAGDGFPVMSFFGQLTDGRLLLTTQHCRNLNCTGPVDLAAHQDTGTFGLYSDLMVVPGRFATASYTNPDLFEAGMLYCRRDDCRDSSQVVFERAPAENAPISLTDMDYQASLNRYVVLYQLRNSTNDLRSLKMAFLSETLPTPTPTASVAPQASVTPSPTSAPICSGTAPFCRDSTATPTCNPQTGEWIIPSTCINNSPQLPGGGTVVRGPVTVQGDLVVTETAPVTVIADPLIGSTTRVEGNLQLQDPTIVLTPTSIDGPTRIVLFEADSISGNISLVIDTSKLEGFDPDCEEVASSTETSSDGTQLSAVIDIQPRSDADPSCSGSSGGGGGGGGVNAAAWAVPVALIGAVCLACLVVIVVIVLILIGYKLKAYNRAVGRKNLSSALASEERMIRKASDSVNSNVLASSAMDDRLD